MFKTEDYTEKNTQWCNYTMMTGAEKQEANMPKICALYNVKRIPEKLIFSIQQCLLWISYAIYFTALAT